jgi:hypothetical protein
MLAKPPARPTVDELPATDNADDGGRDRVGIYLLQRVAIELVSVDRRMGQSPSSQHDREQECCEPPCAKVARLRTLLKVPLSCQLDAQRLCRVLADRSPATVHASSPRDLCQRS